MINATGQVIEVANLLRLRISLPYRKNMYLETYVSRYSKQVIQRKTHGNGSISNVRKPNSEVAQWMPSRLYTADWMLESIITHNNEYNLLCVPKRGKIPPKLDRAKLLAASALAANSGYASTRNVKMPE
jgi:hypothetical protein